MPDELKYNYEEIAHLANKHQLMLIILYGSRASGVADEDSDWDVAVMFKHGKRSKDWLRVFRKLEEFFNRELDFAEVSSSSNPLFRWEVFRDGVPLYEDEPGRFDEEQRVARWIFWDTERLRKISWQIIEENYNVT